MDFVAIDFETANSNRSSACSLGIAVVENDKIVQEKSWLIKPEPFYFDTWNTRIHGITEVHVSDKPNFQDCWVDIKSYLHNKLVVAHNASFDISVLRNTLDFYNIEYPELRYLCTYKVARKTWDDVVNYRLDTIAKKLDLLLTHHDALQDSVVCAKVLLKSLEYNNCHSLDNLTRKLEIYLGSLYPSGYRPCSTSLPKGYHVSKSKISSIKDITPTVDIIDKDNMIYNKRIVFTGTLLSMTRNEAMQRVVNVGGIIGSSVTKDTDYLVMGIQDYSLFAGGKQSNKTRKASNLIAEGMTIQIIDEDTFLRLL